MVRVVGSMTVGFDFGLWVVVQWSWVVGHGLMVVGGGSDGPMVGDCGPMGMGRGFDGPMVVVLVPMGHGFDGLMVVDLAGGSDGGGFFFFGCGLWLRVDLAGGGFFFLVSCGIGGRFVVVVVWVVGFWWVVGWWVLW